MDSNTIDQSDCDLESWTGDYPEPSKDNVFYDYYHALWEMRFGYQEDKSKSFEENFTACIKFNYKKNLIKKILNIKTEYFYETGEVI